MLLVYSCSSTPIYNLNLSAYCFLGRALHRLRGPCLDSLHSLCASFFQEDPALDPALQMCLTRAEQRERITSLNLLVMLCLMQPRMLLANSKIQFSCELHIHLRAKTPVLFLSASLYIRSLSDFFILLCFWYQHLSWLHDRLVSSSKAESFSSHVL